MPTCPWISRLAQKGELHWPQDRRSPRAEGVPTASHTPVTLHLDYLFGSSLDHYLLFFCLFSNCNLLTRGRTTWQKLAAEKLVEHANDYTPSYLLPRPSIYTMQCLSQSELKDPTCFNSAGVDRKMLTYFINIFNHKGLLSKTNKKALILT